MPQQNNEAIIIKGDKKFGDKVVFSDLSLTIEKGKVTVILGESGSGKTTLLRILSGLDDEYGDITGGMTKSYVFQEDRLLPNKMVVENIRFVLTCSERDKTTRTFSALEKARLTDAAKLYPSQLSGGMAKRVSLARAIAINADLILMDEPFSSLDLKLKAEIMQDFLNLISETKPTVVMVTHSPHEAMRLGDKICIISNKKIGFEKANADTSEGELIGFLES